MIDGKKVETENDLRIEAENIARGPCVTSPRKERRSVF